MFTHHNHYRYSIGSDAYRILGVSLSALEVHGLKKVDEILGKMEPIKERVLGFWQKFQGFEGAPHIDEPKLKMPPMPAGAK